MSRHLPYVGESFSAVKHCMKGWQLHCSVAVSQSVTLRLPLLQTLRRFSVSRYMEYRKKASAWEKRRGVTGRIPYDKRYPIFPRDVGPFKLGGSRELAKILGKGDSFPQRPGYEDENGQFHLVPEMIPEFVVPDLTDFKLKPYVSYRAAQIHQEEFTAKDLFNACYARDIVKQYKEGTLKDLDSLLPVKEEMSSS